MESRFVFLSHLEFSPQEKAIIGLVRTALWEIDSLKRGAKERWVLSGGFATFFSLFVGLSLESLGLGASIFFATLYVFYEIFVPIQTNALETLPRIFPHISKKHLPVALAQVKGRDPVEILSVFRLAEAEIAHLDMTPPRNLL